jgi:hypothetical protein
VGCVWCMCLWVWRRWAECDVQSVVRAKWRWPALPRCVCGCARTSRPKAIWSPLVFRTRVRLRPCGCG